MEEESLPSGPDAQAVKESAALALGRFAPSLLPSASALLDRICTPNWTLEWVLPRWLWRAFGLPPEEIAALLEPS